MERGIYINNVNTLDDFIVCDSNKMITRFGTEHLDERETINKINLNQDQYFNFSKNLIDVGGYIGVYSFLTNFNKNFIFEGNEELFYIIHGNAAILKKVYNTYIYNTLLSDKEENIIYDGYNCELGGSPTFDKSYGVPHKANTLDYFNIDNVGLIKVDVEGMEERVLRGGVGTIIRNNYPPILFECWDVEHYGSRECSTAMTQEKHDSLFNFLKGLGYEILEYWGDNQTHLAVHKNQLNK